jgi:hypothetical protein
LRSRNRQDAGNGLFLRLFPSVIDLFSNCYSTVFRLLFPREFRRAWLISIGAQQRRENREISTTELLKTRIAKRIQMLAKTADSPGNAPIHAAGKVCGASRRTLPLPAPSPILGPESRSKVGHEQ